MKNRTHRHCWWECKMMSHSGKVWQFLVKLNIHLPCDVIIPLLGSHPREMKIYIHIDICIQMFTAVLFKINRNRKQCKYTSTGEWMWYLHIMDYYSEIKRNEFLINTIYMNLKGITLKKRQSPQVTYCIFPLTRYFQKDRKKKKKNIVI